MLLAPAVQATNTDPQPEHKVTICHRTASADKGELKNGYNEITVDIASINKKRADKFLGKHEGHQQQANGPGPDIIPAFTATTKDGQDITYNGANLTWEFADGTTGQEFLDNGCQFNTPEQPEPIVEVEESTVDRMSCDAGVEEKTTVVTLTTPYVWDEGMDKWVLGETVTETVEGEWTFVRDLTNAELTELECVDEPNEPVEPTEPEEPVLPATGGNGPGLAAGIALALATLGGIAFAASRRRGTDSI